MYESYKYCGICGRPTSGLPREGAKVYHWDCLFRSCQKIRQDYRKMYPNDPRLVENASQEDSP